LATVVLDGEGQVKAGEEAVFDATVTLGDQPYSNADVKRLKYILYDTTGTVVEVGDATAVGEGQYQVTLSAETTSKLQTGSGRLEVAVVALPVAVPSFTSFDFVVVP
jgi:hypothetical protein